MRRQSGDWRADRDAFRLKLRQDRRRSSSDQGKPPVVSVTVGPSKERKDTNNVPLQSSINDKKTKRPSLSDWLPPKPRKVKSSHKATSTLHGVVVVKTPAQIKTNISTSTRALPKRMSKVYDLLLFSVCLQFMDFASLLALTR